MSREMFKRSHNPLLSYCLRHFTAEDTDHLWIIAERADVNDGIKRIAIDVNNWRKIDVKAHFFDFGGNYFALLIRQASILRALVCGPQRHIAGKISGDIAGQTHHVATLLINRDE